MMDNIVGKHFGKLEVISFDKTKNNKGYYLCHCECGNIKSIRRCSLTSGTTKSCGCGNGKITRVNHKYCTKCSIEKILENFPTRIYKNNLVYTSICKTCVSTRLREYNIKNRETIANKRKNYILLNKDKIAKQQKIRTAKNKDRKKLYDKQYNEKNKDKKRQQSKVYQALHKDKIDKYRHNWYIANKDRLTVANKLWKLTNKHLVLAYCKKRKVSIVNRLPKWVDLAKINILYEQAVSLTNTTGIEHVVDHIYPLHGKIVCGLHVHNNLQVITEKENLAKGNKMPEDFYSSILYDI